MQLIKCGQEHNFCPNGTKRIFISYHIHCTLFGDNRNINNINNGAFFLVQILLDTSNMFFDVKPRASTTIMSKTKVSNVHEKDYLINKLI